MTGEEQTPPAGPRRRPTLPEAFEQAIEAAVAADRPDLLDTVLVEMIASLKSGALVVREDATRGRR